MMKSINQILTWHFLSRFLLLAVLGSLLSCASVDKKKGKQAKGQKDGKGEQIELTAEDAVEPFVLIPNPYTPGSVPGPAKVEYAKVKELMSAKKWAQAKGLLTLMVETYPALAGPYINLGIAHQSLGELEDAEKAFKFAIETNPQNLNAYSQLGYLYREQGRFDESEAIYLKALAIWPHHLPSVKNLGILYDLYMGRLEEALPYYRLTQNLLGGEDRTLRGWIADLKRRLNTQ
ncbi:MAG: tetratricopeptide repeat protein [Agarilytica sp.]